MSKIILVRHSLPQIDPDRPAREWRLSDTGRLRCEWLANALAPYGLRRVVSSREPKAVETGQIVARVLRIPFATAEDLHEHDRSNVVGFGTQEAFEARVAAFFERPRELCYGHETADEAHRRFAGAVETVVAAHPDEDLAIVAHGTVITLLVARAAGLEPFAFWKRLGLPCFIVLSLPGFELSTVVEEVFPR